MKDRSKAKKRVVLRSRDIHVGWIVGVGVLTVIFLLATFATAYRHDVYSSSLGLLVYAFLAGKIGGSGDSEEQELHPTTKTSEVKEEAPAVEEKAPATEQPERVIINEARLRDIFDSEFMHEWVREGKTYLDQVIEDLQFVRDNYVKGSKQDEEHFAAKHVIEIASILRKDRYFRRVYNSFTG